VLLTLHHPDFFRVILKIDKFTGFHFIHTDKNVCTTKMTSKKLDEDLLLYTLAKMAIRVSDKKY